jgi:hypothetical protein
VLGANVVPAVFPMCATTFPELFNTPMSYVLLVLSAVETSYVTCVVVSGNVSTTPHNSALFAVLEKLIAVPVVFVVNHGIEYDTLLLTLDPGMSRNICTVALPELACSTRPRICVPVGRVAPASWQKG